MHSHQLELGRTFGITFDHGEDFFTALTEFCASNDLRQGYLPGFIAGFSQASVVGTCERLDDPNAPVWSEVHLANVEVIGTGTVAWDHDERQIRPHIHVSVGLKEHSATAHTSHLLGARVQFLAELLFLEVVSPTLSRHPDASLYDVPLLRFGIHPT